MLEFKQGGGLHNKDLMVNPLSRTSTRGLNLKHLKYMPT